MTDAEDKEKAEKIAAAKKRYEQIKKQKAKKGGAKKKDDKPETDDTATSASTEKPDDAADGVEAAGTTEDTEDGADTTKSAHASKPSITLESRLRSNSFRRNTLTSPILPPLSPVDGAGAAGDVFRKQALRIEELEKENKRLQSEAGDAERRWKKTEEELEELREASGEVAELKNKADRVGVMGDEMEKLKTELASLQRQNAHLQTQTTKHARRISTSSPSYTDTTDLAAQLASKAATIESLELEISNLHAQATAAQSTTSAHLTQISGLSTALAKAESAAASSAQELADLKQNLERASERAVAEGSSRSSAETRIAQLDASLATATRHAAAAAERAELLERKVETLTTLHRESDVRSQARTREHQRAERELAECRTRLTGLGNENARLREAAQRRRKAEVSGVDDDDGGVLELVDEERERMAAMVRELEEEVFELRRGVWRERRREMQPALDPDAAGFQDVDLSGDQSPQQQQQRARGRGVGSSFQDVISSGISAFTGQAPRRESSAAKGVQPRKQSLGLLSEDDDMEFDEEAFRKAQEEEGRRRIERVREVKRGLKAFEGWRVDVVDVRAGAGGVFEV
ncbi:uncharacterized protein BDZ99DRAFT_504994 [Mytilinidion resinicola]|uniref:M protein repeat protein n=1 Tax=Mytilinidion resinicola TaxID=574789 RepID=A0A6A6Z833_9PEZI|nr:uncharacterized protein BDZ99DRAFT_504994 [Mytilinidion resinicola]KAF2817170.1 hypothetical protein BDZ99DRAFT_504994 [Mytilinidion resinicola]